MYIDTPCCAQVIEVSDSEYKLYVCSCGRYYTIELKPVFTEWKQKR